MSRFASQIRLHKWTLDETRRHVGDLVKLADQLEADRRRLDAECAAEQAAAAQSIELARAYPAYAVRLIERRDRLDRSIAETAEQLSQARDRLTEAFAELKKFELAAAAEAERTRRAGARREQAQQDELGLTIHRRRQAS